MNLLSLNIKKFTICMILLFGLTSSSVFADIVSCGYNRDTDMAVISGSAKPEGAVSLRVESGTEVIYEDQVNSDVNGFYAFSFKVFGQAGDYIITVGEEDVKAPAKTTLHYFGDLTSLLSEINDISKSKNDTLMKEKLLANLDCLFGADSDIKKKLADTAADYTSVYKKLTDGTVYGGIEDIKSKIQKLLVLHDICSAKDINTLMNILEKEKKLLLIDADTAYETLSDSNMLESNTKNEICTGILGRDYKDISEFKTYFDDRVLTIAAKRANGWGDIKAVIEKNAELIGVDTSKVKNEKSVYSYILTCRINSKDDIKNAFNSALANSSGVSGGGGGPGSGSGSGGGGGKTSVIADNSGNSSKDYYAADTFSDLDGVPWAKAAIEKLAKAGVVDGPGDGTFMPDMNITREAFVKMLTVAFNIYSGTDSVSFDDVPENEWYYGYVASAVRCGIVNGTDERHFGTGELITRQDMAVIAARAIKYIGRSLPAERQPIEFADEGDISEYALESVRQLTAAGIINGMGDSMFCPAQTATRAQVAVIISSLCDLK